MTYEEIVEEQRRRLRGEDPFAAEPQPRLLSALGMASPTPLDPELFPDATVWSMYGQGYGYVPLVLPFLGLAWLWRVSRSQHAAR